MKLRGRTALAARRAFILVSGFIAGTAPSAVWAQSNAHTAELPEPLLQPPSPSPFLAPQSGREDAPPVYDGQLQPIRAVRVHSQESGDDALPPKGWNPPTDTQDAVGLEYRSGEPLDAGWVQAQFDRNIRPDGTTPSTAVELIQLINRAFITAGFINTGLLVERLDPAASALDIQLVYGRLASQSHSPITIEWAGGHKGGLSESYVRTRFASTRRQPLSAVELERDFRLLDESPEVDSISAALQPGALPGEANLHLLIQSASRYDLYFGAGNDRSTAVGGNRGFAGGYFRNLLTSGDLLSAEGGITRGVKDGEITYNSPIFSPRLSLVVRASINNSAVVTQPLEVLDIRAKDRSADIGLNYYFIRGPLMPGAEEGRWRPSQSLSAGVSVTRSRQKSYLLGERFSFAPGAVDGRAEYDAVKFSTDYLSRGISRVLAASLSATVGLDGTRSDIRGVPNPDRHWIGLLGQINFVQRLGSELEFRSRLIGQYSKGTLYSGARIAVGGAGSVRGYRENLFLTDRAVIGSIELAKELSLFGTPRQDRTNWGAFTASVFLDAAAFTNAENPKPGKKSIGSIGAALAWTPSEALDVMVSYGYGLTHIETPGVHSLQDKGVHFRILMHPLSLWR